MKRNYCTVDVLMKKVDDNPQDGGQSTKQDSIEEAIDKKSNINEEVAKEAAEKIAKEHKERKVEETTRLIVKSDYLKSRQLLVLKLARRKEEAAKILLTGIDKLNTELNEGKHDKASYNSAFDELRKNHRETLRKAERQFSDYIQKAKNNLPGGYYEWGWDYLLDD